MTAMLKLSCLSPSNAVPQAESHDMNPPARGPIQISDLDDVKAWIAENDGRTYAWWDEQRRTNKRCLDSHEKISLRLSALEKRVIWLTAFASGVGGIIGQVVSKFAAAM